MSEQVVSLTERSEVGKKAKFLRSEGLLPGSVNVPGKDSQNIQIDAGQFERLYKDFGKTQPFEIDLAGAKNLAMIKEVDREPVKKRLIHFTLQVVNRNQEVSTDVPIHYDEDQEVPAKKMGLELLSVTHSLEVKALPQDLPEVLYVDATKLSEVGDRILVKEIELPKGVSIASEDDLEKVVFIVEAPRVTSEEDLSNEAPEGSADSVESDKGGASTEEASSEESQG